MPLLRRKRQYSSRWRSSTCHTVPYHSMPDSHQSFAQDDFAGLGFSVLNQDNFIITHGLRCTAVLHSLPNSTTVSTPSETANPTPHAWAWRSILPPTPLSRAASPGSCTSRQNANHMLHSQSGTHAGVADAASSSAPSCSTYRVCALRAFTSFGWVDATATAACSM